MPVDYDLEDVAAIGAQIAAVLRPGDAVGLIGGLGAGKTTLVRAILKAMGLAGEAPSPSFAIVQPYAPPELPVQLLHIDLYRIEDAEEIEELGLDEARGDHILLIEWPERMGRYAWPDMLMLTIAETAEKIGAESIAAEVLHARRLTAAVPPAWEGRWPLST
jgi:tRNA threonylcarbamoyladenosine biosynthesis protein TsaE